MSDLSAVAILETQTVATSSSLASVTFTARTTGQRATKASFTNYGTGKVYVDGRLSASQATRVAIPSTSGTPTQNSIPIPPGSIGYVVDLGLYDTIDLICPSGVTSTVDVSSVARGS